MSTGHGPKATHKWKSDCLGLCLAPSRHPEAPRVHRRSTAAALRFASLDVPLPAQGRGLLNYVVPSRPIASTQLKLGLRVPSVLSIERGTQICQALKNPLARRGGQERRKEAAAKPGSQPERREKLGAALGQLECCGAVTTSTLRPVTNLNETLHSAGHSKLLCGGLAQTPGSPCTQGNRQPFCTTSSLEGRTRVCKSV